MLMPWWVTCIVMGITVLRYHAWEMMITAFIFDSLYTPYPLPAAIIIVLILVWSLEPIRERLW